MRDIGWEDEVEYSLDDLSSDERVRQVVEAAPGVRWTAYVLGVLFLLKQWFPDRLTRGANIHIRSEVPMGKGMGSSAALGRV